MTKNILDVLSNTNLLKRYLDVTDSSSKSDK